MARQCSVYPIENYNRGMGGNSNFARPMLPTYIGCTVYDLYLNSVHSSSMRYINYAAFLYLPSFQN